MYEKNNNSDSYIGRIINSNRFNSMKKYLISSFVTFVAGFFLVLLTNWDGVTLEAFKDGSIFGVLFVASRAGVKAVIEFYLSRYTTLLER